MNDMLYIIDLCFNASHIIVNHIILRKNCILFRNFIRNNLKSIHEFKGKNLLYVEDPKEFTKLQIRVKQSERKSNLQNIDPQFLIAVREETGNFKKDLLSRFLWKTYYDEDTQNIRFLNKGFVVIGHHLFPLKKLSKLLK